MGESAPLSGRARPRDFVSIGDWPREALERILERAHELKAARARGEPTRTLAGRSILLYFEKPSLRTQVTFEVGIGELGATSVCLHPGQVGIGEREAVEDVARNVSRWCHAMVARTFAHDLILELARHATIPVVNALSDDFHPCQAMADVQTVQEHGDLRRDRVTYLGDGNNVAHSLILAAGRLGMRLTVCTPPRYAPKRDIVRRGIELAGASGGEVLLETDPRAAVKDACFVYTDVWASMGQEEEAAERREIFEPYQVNDELLRHAPRDARILHCLPAHRGEEIAADVFESDRSLVFDQAENRLHAQKAILEALVLDPS
jgi:ornithine carbamoyltransferase